MIHIRHKKQQQIDDDQNGVQPYEEKYNRDILTEWSFNFCITSVIVDVALAGAVKKKIYQNHLEYYKCVGGCWVDVSLCSYKGMRRS